MTALHIGRLTCSKPSGFAGQAGPSQHGTPRLCEWARLERLFEKHGARGPLFAHNPPDITELLFPSAGHVFHLYDGLTEGLVGKELRVVFCHAQAR
jgi:hypothetical protein